ncbi:MAG TPA: hypothetical protein VNH18_03445, partial [Bryobacteraceae bacterium]|nr:hypothetical protein [Bryobacteraceae bacterium]
TRSHWHSTCTVSSVHGELKMQEKTTTLEDANSAARAVGDKVSDMASQVRAKVSDIGHAAADKIDQNRIRAASNLENAAASIQDKADTVTGLANSAANRLNYTADYLRVHDANDMVGHVRRIVRHNPGPALLAAAVFGFLVGRAVTSHD